MRTTIGLVLNPGLMMTGLTLTGAMLLSGCHAKQKRADADIKAAQSGFVPPAVTSRVDYGSQMERRFRALDTNGDDRLTPDEMPRKTTQLAAFDIDKDGAVSAIEWSEGMAHRFDDIDLNHDGTVTSEEQGAYRAARAAGRPATTPSMVGDQLSNGTAAAR